LGGLFVITMLAVGFTAPSAAGQVVVNEAMVNEPGRFTALEWFELYIDSDQSVSLGSYRVIIGQDTIGFPERSLVPPHTYLVVCRKLESAGGAESFEAHWGDSSGVWGDTPEEAALWPPIEAVFSLSNEGGSIELFDGDISASALSWADPGDDGISWERTEPESASVVPSVDPDGSTPGFVNSVTPVGNDLSIDEIALTVEDGWTLFEFIITNRGLLPHVASRFQLIDLAADSGDLLLELTVPALQPGESTALTAELQFEGMYVSLVASLPDDSRPRNNRVDFTAPAAEFPPFLMTEMQPRPSQGAEREWIEIENRYFAAYDLGGWRIGDCGQEMLISDTAVVLQPGRRAVLVRSATAFKEDYPDFDGLLVELSSWLSLNDGGDTICLVDQFDLRADRFAYTTVFDDDYTWCRGEEPGQRDQWGRSEQVGGSPGEVNTVLFGDQSGELAVTVTPEVFSPDGDGYQDSVVITIAGPDADNFVLKVYDRQGRIVRRLENGSYRLDSYVWHGRSDGGARLPVGIYILYAEIEGVGSVKKPIVIAR